MKKITKDELRLCRDVITECVKASIKRRDELFDAGVISLADSLLISSEESALLSTANRAASLVISDLLTDMNAPGKVLNQVTEDLQDVIQRLKELNQFLSILTSVVNVFQQIITASAGGLGAVATIGPLINEVQRLIALV